MRVKGTAMYSAKAPIVAPKTRSPILSWWSLGFEDDGDGDEGMFSIVPAKSYPRMKGGWTFPFFACTFWCVPLACRMSACWGVQGEIGPRYSFGLGVGIGTVVGVRVDGSEVKALGMRIACIFLGAAMVVLKLYLLLSVCLVSYVRKCMSRNRELYVVVCLVGELPRRFGKIDCVW